ncbi:MAG: hypothetical protein M1822_004975 [Bathelium mastoideum]|nr:MAG: hypothetical protein M1822_004975 [Bathelium mastoideum]
MALQTNREPMAGKDSNERRNITRQTGFKVPSRVPTQPLQPRPEVATYAPARPASSSPKPTRQRRYDGSYISTGQASNSQFVAPRRRVTGLTAASAPTTPAPAAASPTPAAPAAPSCSTLIATTESKNRSASSSLQTPPAKRSRIHLFSIFEDDQNEDNGKDNDYHDNHDHGDDHDEDDEVKDSDIS